MRIAIVTDAWYPQTNGVVRSLDTTATKLRELGHHVRVVTGEGCRTMALPTYPDIRLALLPGRRVRKTLREFAPQAVHIATEGPVGLAARGYCLRQGIRFTTSYHTQFPQYIRMRAPLPVSWTYHYLRWFHGAAERTMAATESMRDELRQHGFDQVVIWSRGVDTELFCPRDKFFLEAPRPIAVYVGRIAVEKNVEAFLRLDLPGSKFVIGDGPDRLRLQRLYPQTRFTGFLYGEQLARHLASADVFVFPSRTDTFGLVMLEAMACGVPVAAYPVTGPIDVIQDGVTGALDEDLGRAMERALTLDGAHARRHALERSWHASAAQFLSHLHENPTLAAVAN